MQCIVCILHLFMLHWGFIFSFSRDSIWYRIRLFIGTKCANVLAISYVWTLIGRFSQCIAAHMLSFTWPRLGIAARLNEWNCEFEIGNLFASPPNGQHTVRRRLYERLLIVCYQLRPISSGHHGCQLCPIQCLGASSSVAFLHLILTAGRKFQVDFIILTHLWLTSRRRVAGTWSIYLCAEINLEKAPMGQICYPPVPVCLECIPSR